MPGGPELYEHEIEQLLWNNLEEFTGVPLFPVARQPQIAGGGRPDMVALDEEGHVAVIEVKRDVDRNQLAQCLEYAGWARSTSLDELANLYHGGADAFFSAWQEFTQTPSPLLLRRPPMLILAARDFHGRTDSAFAFLRENQLPVTVLNVNMYEDKQGRRFIDVSGDHEPEFLVSPESGSTQRARPQHVTIEGRRISLSDLLEAGLLEPGEPLVWDRPRVSQTYKAEVLPNGLIRLADGREYTTPSRAAMDAAKIPAYDGWLAWRLPRRGNRPLDDLRAQLVRLHEPSDSEPETANVALPSQVSPPIEDHP